MTGPEDVGVKKLADPGPSVPGDKLTITATATATPPTAARGTGCRPIYLFVDGQ